MSGKISLQAGTVLEHALFRHSSMSEELRKMAASHRMRLMSDTLQTILVLLHLWLFPSNVAIFRSKQHVPERIDSGPELKDVLQF